MTSTAAWSTIDDAPTSVHACNCIGCCPDCGTCRTWTMHTPAYCELVQQQQRDRAALIEQQRNHRDTSERRGL